MKKLLTAFIAAICALGAVGWETLPQRYDGSMMPFDFRATQSMTLPDTLTPRYCAYVARHGARYMTGPGKFKALQKALRDAGTDGSITAEGKAFLAMLDTIQSLSEGSWGQLSPVGLEEERRLGAMMLRDFPAIRGPEASAVTLSTFVPRAIMTMYEFNHALAWGNDSLALTAGSGVRYSPLLYFFASGEYSKMRKHGPWEATVAAMERDSISLEPLQRLLGPSARRMEASHARKLVMEMYSVLQSRRAMGLPSPTTRWMSLAQYRRCWAVSNLTHYLRNNVNPQLGDLAASAAAPLLATIIDHADSAAAKGKAPRLEGYFGHAETLLPLLSAMRIPGCYAMPRDYNTLQHTWRLEEITPLGANLAVFLLDSPSGTVYAAVRLNGHDVAPLPGKGTIVKWNDLRDYWSGLLMAASQSIIEK